MFKLKFETDNAAFESSTGDEAARILRQIAERLENYDTDGAVMDANGNKIGAWSLSLR